MSDCSGPCITGVEQDSSRCGPPCSGWPALSSPGSRVRSVHACWGSQTAQSPKSTRVHALLSVAFHSPTSVGALDEQLSRRNGPPTCLPTDFSSVPSRRPPHGSGPGGSLDLPRNGLAPYTPYRSPGKSGRNVSNIRASMIRAKLASVFLAHRTASACARRNNGIVRPKAWVVMRLMPSVKGLGGSTDPHTPCGKARVMTVNHRR